MPAKQGGMPRFDAPCNSEECTRLAERSRSGDAQAFEIVLYQARKKIQKYVFGRLNPRGYGDDLVSIGEQLLWREAIPKFRAEKVGGGGFESYAKTILMPRLRDELRTLIHGQAVVDGKSYRKLGAAYDGLVQNGEDPTAKRLHEESGCHLDTCYRYLFTRVQYRPLFGTERTQDTANESGAGEGGGDALADSAGNSQAGAEDDLGDGAPGEPGLTATDPNSLSEVPSPSEDAIRLLTTDFVVDIWLPYENPRMARILQNELGSFAQAGRTDADLARELSCAPTTVSSDKVTAKAWLAIVVELTCHLSGCSNQVAHDRLKSWIDGVPADETKDEPKADKLLRRFRDRRKLKLEDVRVIREKLGEYEEARRRDGTHENA